MKADPQAIERQLRQIQQELAPGESRTSLFNLVVFVGKEDDRPLIDALNTLHGKRPARVIVIRPTDSPETEVEVTARCVPDDEGRDLCIQEIVLFSGKDGSGEAPETWTPLLIREIPVYVWWLGDPSAGTQGSPATGFFDDAADRCFIDSTRCPRPAEFYAGLSGRLPALRTPVSDFAWTRIAPLLKLVAHFFNPVPLRERLHNLVKVTLRGGDSAEALLFFQWMKTKMDWQGSLRPAGNTWSLKAEDRSVVLVHEPGRSLSLGFDFAFETADGQVLTLKDSGEGYALAALPGGESYTEIFRIPGTEEILLTEVDRSGSDRLYAESLAAF